MTHRVTNKRELHANYEKYKKLWMIEFYWKGAEYKTWKVRQNPLNNYRIKKDLTRGVNWMKKQYNRANHKDEWVVQEVAKRSHETGGPQEMVWAIIFQSSEDTVSQPTYLSY